MSGGRSDADSGRARALEEDAADGMAAATAEEDVRGGTASSLADNHPAARAVPVSASDAAVTEASPSRTGPGGTASVRVEPSAKRARVAGGSLDAGAPADALAGLGVAPSLVGHRDDTESSVVDALAGAPVRQALQAFLASTGLSPATFARGLHAAALEGVRSLCALVVQRWTCGRRAVPGVCLLVFCSRGRIFSSSSSILGAVLWPSILFFSVLFTGTFASFAGGRSIGARSVGPS